MLAAYGNRALLEYNPIRWPPQIADRVYRTCDFGPLVEVFLRDLRSHRAANSANLQSPQDTASALLGPQQQHWLQARLAYSRATWKIIARSPWRCVISTIRSCSRSNCRQPRPDLAVRLRYPALP